jgi:carboxylate-amine ligase
MVRMIPYLPLFLALSTSSPFWQARRTGLMGYRLAAYDELPRTGLPDLFEDAADYQSYIDTLIASRAIADSTHIWWAIRPSLKHPTLELRVADSCTRVEDVIGLAALYRALVRHLDRNPSLNAGMKASHRALALENKWRAQRYGIHGSFVDAERRALVSVPEALNEVLDMLDADLVALDCRREAHNLKEIFERGTSADGQIALFTDARGRGVSHGRALAEVVDWLATTTSGVQMEQLRPRLH